MLGTLAATAGVLIVGTQAASSSDYSSTCDTVQHGYQCDTQISHFWGEYAPYFSIPSDISTDVPSGCEVTFAQVLSRHGARNPTTSKTAAYNTTIAKIHANVKNYSSEYAFIESYKYSLGANDLTTFGQQEMINSGVKFYDRYEALAAHNTPFVRSSSDQRVVESAENFTQGFHAAKTADRSAIPKGDPAYPYTIVQLSEDTGSNDTLDASTCTNFEDGPDSDISDDAQLTWADIFITPIQARLNAGMLGANLTVTDTINIMDLCPFNTVFNANGTISQFCSLFTETEWHQYNYYETLGKYYGYSYGNPLGPSQGVGFTNELIARLTNTAVEDDTSTNHTLDSSNATFPLGKKLYADFSHDNPMTAIFSAIGLWNGTAAFPNTTVVEAQQANGYSAAWTVPFAARAYFEKLQCHGHAEELVRVIINDRVNPLKQCGGDDLGRCSLSSFIDSLGFAKEGGDWDQCYS